MLFVLLPPSEGKVAAGDGPGWTPDLGEFPDLGPARVRVANALRRARGGTAKQLGARGELLNRAKTANRSLIGAATLPAWRRFSGVVWEALDPETLRAPARRRAEAGVLVISAVTGVSAWNDPVPDFRLKLSASVSPLGRLAAFWQAPLTKVLNDRLEGHTVFDLLPNEHRAAWIPDPDRYELVRPVLATADGKPAGHAGKAAKGRLARALVESAHPHRTLASFDAGDLVITVASRCSPDHPVR